MVHQKSVARYYDGNTKRFLPSRRSREIGTIHRMLYGPGVASRTRAMQYVDSLVAEEILNRRSDRALDLGCGVGGTIRYLQNSSDTNFVGITISKVQAEIGRALDTAIEVADFLDPAWFSLQQPFQFIYAIESLQHNPDHRQLMRNLQSVAESGSYLLVIDDFIRDQETGEHPRRVRNLLERFKTHWHAYGFSHVGEFIGICESAGYFLEEKTDLSGYMRNTPALNRIYLVMSALLRLLPADIPWADNIIGGNALKLLQEKEITGYYKLLFRKK